jgi:hypothetical protein
MGQLTIKDKDLNSLFQKILPPEEFGEDSNVEELYNRIIDLEAKSNTYRLSLADELIKYVFKNTEGDHNCWLSKSIRKKFDFYRSSYKLTIEPQAIAQEADY